MEAEEIVIEEDLKNKPLVEAIFEVRWEHDKDPAKSSFQLVHARYYDRVSEDYPEVEPLPIVMVPEALTLNQVRHRYRVGPNEWPLTQIGPGILTVNETVNYKWEPFRERIQKSLKALMESFGRPRSLVWSPVHLELRYINVVPFDWQSSKITEFVSTYLHTKIQLDEKLLDGANEAGLDFSVSLNLDKPNGVGTLMLGSGEADGRLGVLWQIIIRTKPGHVPNSYGDIITWIEEAHRVVETWFFNLARGELMDQFKGKVS